MRKNTDTIPAKLTPREAVLNRNAAELLGRDTIKRLNDHGNILSKRGVDLASLQSDPAPYPASENLAGLQMGTADVGRDDRADLLRDAENTFYGGGQVPVPTPTPTPPVRGYAYGTSNVDDDPFLKKRNAASRVNRPGIMNVQDDPTKPNYSPISASQYLGRGGTLLGPQYNPTSGRVNPLPSGVVGIQGFSQPQTSNQNLNNPAKSLTHTEMATDIARRNLTSTGSQLGTQSAPQQIPAGFQGYVSPQDAASKGLQWTGGSTGWQPYVSPEQATKQNLQFTGGLNNIPSQQDQSTVHFLPPGFTATTGSTGAPGSTPNDIHFLPPGFSSVQGVTNPVTKQLQQPDDEGYGSAYGY